MQHLRLVRAGLAVLLAWAAFPASAEKLARDIDIASEGGIATDWRVADGSRIVAPPYPAEYDGDARPDACIAMQYTIFPDGTTGDFRVLRAWKSGPPVHGALSPFWIRFARAGVAAVGQWKFEPRDPAHVRPVTTVATLSFFGETAWDAAELRAHCKITDLAVLIRDLQRRDTLDLEAHRGREPQSERCDSRPGGLQLDFRKMRKRAVCRVFTVHQHIRASTECLSWHRPKGRYIPATPDEGGLE
ncbi:energy transducer TonB [Lysobacter sp. A6]|uniref:Energy transducer TonB n=1 Tax=Noviluteimonas lactosilytica TaxID=2888523 RepID=A0ABS8JEB8_9GAMM|nr:energy transducer TonB [Lysobacter lactosilyticus]MCC8361941.1 energy transducer TonB [Lysobacter lactosilyticus]